LVELRRFVRTPLDAAVSFTRKSAAEVLSGRAMDVSLGGMFVETASAFPFGSDVTLRVRLPQCKDELSLPGIVRWVGEGGMGIQFGNLGAKETHEITEFVKRAEH
jgi:type IV pilus assembly protein PilZ